MTQSILWVIIPQFLVMIAVVSVIIFVNQRVVVSLLVDRDRQLAMISASRISQAVDEYISKLQFLADDYLEMTDPGGRDWNNLYQAINTLGLSGSNIAIIDSTGTVFERRPNAAAPSLNLYIGKSHLDEAMQQNSPTISDLILEQESGNGMIIASVPFRSASGEGGIVLGGFQVTESPIRDLIKGLKVGDEGFAYLVDRRGRVIYHPDQNNIGIDFSDRYFVSKAMGGLSGGRVETTPDGERLVVGYAPIEDIGWGLVVREPWDEVIEPVQVYGGITVLAILSITGMTTWYLWMQMKKITTPIRQLEEQAAHLGAGGAIEPIFDSGIHEIDHLADAFMQMVDQVTRYRARLQRHLRAVTHSQDEERRRVSRELHDETIQNLLVIDRQLELLNNRDDEIEIDVFLSQTHEMIQETIRGVRQIVRNLRPLMLEDLGLIPAIESMLSSLVEEEPDLAAHLNISGERKKLSPALELAVYRIIQEALTNCKRHAQASKVQVQLQFEDNELCLSIQDDGRGFGLPKSIAEFADLGHFGLMGIEERVAALGATLQVDSSADRGTNLSVMFPLNGV